MPDNIQLNPADYLMTDGYVGSMGKTYEPCTETTLAKVIQAAADFNQTTPDAIRQQLADGRTVKWQKSPNYYYDHSYGLVGRKRTPKPIQMKTCSCGHTIPADQVMMASLGTSCPDCYDRMSD